MAFRTRAMAPKVLVRGLRWAISRRNSRVCRFFWRGYSSGSAWPRISRRVALISYFWFLPSDSTNSPTALTLQPVLRDSTRAKSGEEGSTTICRSVRVEPSLIWMKETAPEERRVLTQPWTSTSPPGVSRLRMSLTLVRCIAMPPAGPFSPILALRDWEGKQGTTVNRRNWLLKYCPNAIIIAGDGRIVGQTFFKPLAPSAHPADTAVCLNYPGVDIASHVPGLA